MNRFLFYLISIGVLSSFSLDFISAQSSIQWEAWSKLPENPALVDSNEMIFQPGLAGAFSGVSGGMLIVAGGANFPYNPPWEEGEKVYWDQIYLKDASASSEPWLISEIKLPVPIAYGVSAMKDDRLFMIGGENAEGAVEQVLSLYWDSRVGKLLLENYAPIPEGVKVVSGGVLDQKILVHGIKDRKNVLLELKNDRTWKILPGCPGLPREFPSTAIQSNGQEVALYLFSGRSTSVDGEIKLLKDGYRYDPIQQKWQSLGPVGNKIDEGICIMAASAVPIGASHILVFGGDQGEEFRERVDIENKILTATNYNSRLYLEQRLKNVFENHPGFSKNIFSYHTVTNKWTILDTFPDFLPVTTNVVRWDGNFWITSGEIRPGVRTSKIWKGQILDEENQFGWLNYSVLALYFIVMILIGVKYSRRQKTTEDYFKGGGRIPWWAAGLSLFGTSLSAITFMAIPAKTYMTDWSYFFFQMTPLLVAPILTIIYIPYFRKLNITSAYEYLETRFNLLTRILGSLSFIVLQLGRVAIILFLPSIAVNLVTGISIEFCIIAMGVVSVVYTMMGGIEAVIWTDVLQVFVLMIGAFLSLILIFYQIDLSSEEIYDTLVKEQKFQILETAFDFKRPTIWVVLLGGLFANLITSGSDQTMVQRYLTTSTAQEAKSSVWTFALLAIPATLIFFSIGSALYLFYSENPEMLEITIDNEDAIFPWYIVTQLPKGVSGLLIAGIFSAAMSSLSSSMNSVSTAFITDFYHRFSLGNSRGELRMARLITLIFGVMGTFFALMMSRWNIQSLWDQFQLFIGLFAGGLGGLFLLGMTAKRANSYGAVSGLVLSGIFQYYLMIATDMHVLLFAATGFISCFVLSYLISLFFLEKN